MKHTYQRLIVTMLLFSLLLCPVMAGDITLPADEVYCFGGEELTQNGTGVFVSTVPEKSLGSLKLGNRTICAGDVLTRETLNQLTFLPAVEAQGEAVISCIEITSEGLGETAEMTLKIRSSKNEAPTVEDQDFETYKNIPGEITLKAADPEGDSLTVNIVRQPKRGSLTVSEGTTLIYTPEENKVGKDSFVYTVTDSAGNTSPEATVRIKIEKPTHKETYADLENDPILLAATWLREKGVYCGEMVSGNILFQPDETVTRGEFIAMCVSLTKEELSETVSAGFADDDSIPGWLSPYVSQAVKCGYLSGSPTENGLSLLAQQDISRGEAAVIVSNMLSLSTYEDDQTVFASEDSLPAWAASSVRAVLASGMFDATETDMLLTRREAAQLLYNAWNLAQQQESTLLSWAKE